MQQNHVQSGVVAFGRSTTMILVLIISLVSYNFRTLSTYLDVFQSISNHECPLYTIFNDEMGFSIYAGKRFKMGEKIETVVGIPVKKFTKKTLLDDYVWVLNDTHLVFDLGLGMMYNHIPSPMGPSMIEKVGSSSVHHMRKLKNGEFSSNVDYIAMRDIEPGDQIFSFYGDEFFSSRNIIELLPTGDAVKIAFNSLKENPARLHGCPLSFVGIVNDIAYAMRAIPKGEIIEVSRALLMPKSNFTGTGSIEPFLWRRSCKRSRGCSPTEIQHVVFLLGYGMLYREVSVAAEANLEYRWWNTSVPYSSSTQSRKDYRPSRSLGECQTHMAVAFKAMRDINAGEELRIAMAVSSKSRNRYLVDENFSDYCM